MQKFHAPVALLLLAAFLCIFPAPSHAARGQAAASEGAPLSPQAAFALMAGNAEKGDSAAMLNLGRLYEYGHGVARNYTKALEWYQKAAQAGLPEGYYNVGVCYEIGMGAASDMKKAVENYTKASDMKLPLAMHKLSALYLSGAGVPKDEAAAVQYLIKAAEAGLPQACNDLGMVYMQGLYRQPRDMSVALDWLVVASDAGNLDAMANIATYFDEGTPGKVNLPKALKWYLILQRSGASGSDLDARLAALRGKLSPAQAKSAEAEAEAWVKDFQARNK